MLSTALRLSFQRGSRVMHSLHFCSRAIARSMVVRITEFQSTPNPNAIKCIADRTVPPPSSRTEKPRSYNSIDAASTDPFAHKLLEVQGVRSVLLTDSWFTINRDPAAEWKKIKAAVERAIADV